MTKQERLQALASELRTDDQCEVWIEYRPNRGWFAIASEARWIGDDGEYLGQDYQEARYGLMAILG